MKAILNQNLFKINQIYNTIDWSSESKANKSIKEKGLPIFMNGWVITQKKFPNVGDWAINHQNNALYEWKIKCEIDALPWCNIVIATIGFKINGIRCAESEEDLKSKKIQEIELDEKNGNLIIKSIVYEV